MEEWSLILAHRSLARGPFAGLCAGRRKPPSSEREFYITLGKNHAPSQQSFSALIFPLLMPGKPLLFLHPLLHAAPD